VDFHGVVRDAYHWLFPWWVQGYCRTLDLLSGLGRHGALLAPPALLRFRVGESTGLDEFFGIGRETARAVRRSLEHVGRPLNTFSSALDFGCGCGRTLLWLEGELRTAYGTDVDAEAVQWCRRHFPAVHFDVNRTQPPLAYPDGAFDLIYAISVFTHLDEITQLNWLDELQRVLRSGGVLLFSIHGERCRTGLSMEECERLQRDGMLHKTSSKLAGIVPRGYHTTYHTREYVLGVLRERFSVLAYIDGGLGYQDLVVAERLA